MSRKIRFLLLLPLIVFIVVVLNNAFLLKIKAEQSGSSPESGSSSRLKTASDAIAALSYGSTAAGSWGDWGTMWNRLYSAAQNSFNDAKSVGTKNGTGTGATNYLSSYTKALGGVDDYNNNQTIPADSYQKTWTACNAGNTYCGTGRSVAEKQDPNTGLVWSPRISSSANWFTALNCQQPSNGVAPLGASACSANGDVGCVCVKLASSKTGCDAYDDGNWRLPYQKELMQSYIDGSWANLTNAGYHYWSSTTQSNSTQNAWFTIQLYGYTVNYTKVTNYSVRCVR